MIGKTLDNRYRLLSRLGEGGMGTVYLAEHAILGKKVAVKVLRPEYSRRADLVQRFKQEAVAASQIGHDNIVGVTDFGSTPEGELYFVMEALDGQSLAAVIREGGAMPVFRALPILLQIASALEAAHNRGIVHRDLKPDNVMVLGRADGTDFVKVLDFGISKVTQNGSGSRITQAETVLGTPEYMAPEQATTHDVDLRADVYAFGVVAYELLTGALPFEAETAFAVVMKHQNEIPVPVCRRRPDLAIPGAIEALVTRCLAKRAADRPQSMEEVAGALQVEIGASSGAAARTTGSLPAVAPAPWSSSPTPSRGGTLALSPEELSQPSAPGLPAPLPDAFTPAPLAEPALEPGPATVASLQPTPRVATPEPSPEPSPEPAAAAVPGTRRRAVIGLAMLAVAGAIIGVVAFGGFGSFGGRRGSAGRPGIGPAVPPPAIAAAPVASAPLPAVQPPTAPAPASSGPSEPLPTLRQVTLATRPAGATVSQAGAVLGTTPLILSVRTQAPVRYQFSLAGYRPAEGELSPSGTRLELPLQRDLSRPKRPARRAADSRRGEDRIDDLKNPY